MQPNRLERVWRFVAPEILAKWAQLAPSDLAACEFQYDRIVEKIRQTYYPGRSHLSLEAGIRDWLLERVAHYEKSNAQGRNQR